MSKGFLVRLFLLVGLVASPVMAQSLVPMDPATVTNGHVYLMENVGANVPDDSANNNNGTFVGSPQVVPGLNGNALQFNGASDAVILPNAATINTTTHQNKTYIAVFKCADVSKSEKQCVFEEGGSTRGANIYVHQGLVYAGGWNAADYTPQWAGTFLSAPIASNEWHVVVAVLRDGTAGQADDKFEMWLDGKLVAKGPGGEFRSRTNANGIGYTTQTKYHDGNVTGSAMSYFDGIVDELWILNQALSEAELAAISINRGGAANPAPADGAVDVVADAVLAWKAGEFAATHDVYFGTVFADVNDAGRANPKGVLVSRDQIAAEFDPAGLEYGKTYYWRIDEVNAAPDNTIFKGTTWSFTAEPFAYAVEPVAATASNAQPGMGPENTINGVGLDAAGRHSAVETQMWLSDGMGASWIQYEFDHAYKLDELLVWNSNQLIETFLGFGAKSVTIEYSLDGETWTALDGVPEFAQAPGLATYTANTTVDLGGITAQYVKLTINSNWGGITPQSGLSAVRFFQIPVRAREPMPADGAANVSVAAELNWRPGREATSHEVYLGTDEAAVADGTVAAKTVTDHSYKPASLNFGTEYFWKVNEVGDAGTYEGDVWSFATQEYAAIDDFEAYTDDVDAEATIWHAWVDGLTTGASGSQVGYDVSPFAEKKIVHSGKQSMPLQYDNSSSPFLSEAEQTFAPAQNWTTNGADSLVVYFRGVAPAFVETASGNILMNAIGTDIWGTADQFRYAYKTLNGDGTMIARVESIANSNTWAKGGVMIRQSIEAGSVHAFMPITPGGGNGASFQRRPTANAASANNDSTTVVAAPYWVKIERKGNAFSGYISPDGVAWTQLGAAETVTMTGPVLIGLALTSHDAAIVTGAQFSNISTTGNVTGAWQVAEIGATQPAGNSVEGLYLSVKDTSGKSKVIQHPDTAATAYTSWQEWKIPLSTFTSAGVKMNAVKSIVIGVGNKAAPKTGGTGIVYVDDIGYGRSLQ